MSKRTDDQSYDKRFDRMHKDPRFLPIESRTTADPRFAKMLDESFTMLQDDNRDARNTKREAAMKNVLRGVYKFKKSASDKRVEKILSSVKDDKDYNSDDSVEDAKESFGLTKEDILGGDSEEEKEEEKEYTYDDFLASLANRPGFDKVDDDDVYDFSDDSDNEWQVEDDEAERHELQKDDLWDTFIQVSEAEELQTGEESNRLAVMNCDWTVITATDLFVLFKSMCPTFGNIKSVTTYLSDYGKEQMQQEIQYGPKDVWMNDDEFEEHQRSQRQRDEMEKEQKWSRLVPGNKTKLKEEKKANKRVEEVEDLESTERLHPDKVRLYEFNKLRYYFAVVECDSIETAAKLYSECDGREFESTGAHMDVRFIPNDVDFRGRTVFNSCDHEPAVYKPKQNIFAKSLQSTDVELTWDADDRERDVLKRVNFDKIDESELQRFIGGDSDSSDDEQKREKKVKKEKPKQLDSDEEEKKKEKKLTRRKRKEMEKEKYRNLLDKARKKQDTRKGAVEEEENEDDVDKEEVIDDELEQVAKQVVQSTKEKELLANETWWETAERKRKAAKKQKKKERTMQLKSQTAEIETEEDVSRNKAQLELLMSDYSTSHAPVQGFNVKKDDQKERQRRKEEWRGKLKEKSTEDESMANDVVSDPRFEGLWQNAELSMDPTHPKFKKNKLVDLVVEKKQTKIAQKKNVDKKDIDQLVNNLKRKNQNTNENSAKKFKK